MENLLSRFTNPQAPPEALFTALVAQLRPRRAGDVAEAKRHLQAFCHILETHTILRGAIREQITLLSQTHRHADLYTSSGILPNTGFFSECFRRVGHKILPEALDADLLRSALRRIFNHPSDAIWVTGVGEEVWLSVLDALHFEEQAVVPTLPHPLQEMLRALRTLSYSLAAFGMEPELLRLDPSLETYESPFVAQNIECVQFIDAYTTNWRALDTQQGNAPHDDKHLRVLLHQCAQVLDKIRKRAARDGTSIRLTYHVERLQQLLQRCHQLLDILDAQQADPDGRSVFLPMVQLFTHLIAAECQRNNLRAHWRRNTELLALRITDNASAHGEHYMTETRSEYMDMARSAAIGGAIIACMACCKLLLSKLDMPPLTGALAFCLNYGLGFCLIHILHGTVATKQPAMTANAIAAVISQTGGKLSDLERLTHLIARTVRSQLVAILGNIGIAVPLAALLTYLFAQLTGHGLVNSAKAAHLLSEQHLITSGAPYYAAIAGGCLFLAGLINGYFDNYAAYNRVPERILQLAWPKRWFGEARMRRVAAYLGDNLGALCGNFLFGFLLGGTTIFGILFGLPIDIRHVAFASAFVGIAVVGLDFTPDGWALLWAVLGVAAIGLVNLGVSFSLALKVALRARHVTEIPWRALFSATAQHFMRQPRDFFLPPPKSAARLLE